LLKKKILRFLFNLIKLIDLIKFDYRKILKYLSKNPYIKKHLNKKNNINKYPEKMLKIKNKSLKCKII